MKQFKLLLVSFTLALCVSTSYAIDSFETPTDPVLSKRYQSLSEEFRCLVCQNQNLADSNAELANDLKREIIKLLDRGLTDEEIREYLLNRYGDFVLYRPPVKSSTWLLWGGPFLGVFVGLLALVIRNRRAVKTPLAAESDNSEYLNMLSSKNNNDEQA